MKGVLYDGHRVLEVDTDSGSPAASIGPAFADEEAALAYLRPFLSDPVNLTTIRSIVSESGLDAGVGRLNEQRVVSRFIDEILHGRLGVALPGSFAGGGRGKAPAEEDEDDVKPPAPPGPPEEPVVTPRFAVLSCDDHFAPGVEKLDVAYELEHLRDKRVAVEITGENAPENPIYESELFTAAKTDGKHTFSWDGKSNRKGGALEDTYINPLYGPYKIKFTPDGAAEGEASFKVLYHSIAVRRGTWTADEKDPPEAEEKKWVQFKLNELGYFGGPVGKDTEGYLKKAVIRYKANHKDLHELDYTRYDDAITPALKQALKRGDNRRPYLSDERVFTDDACTARVYVEAVTYEDGEFDDSSAAKVTREQGRLNRPILPVEVEVFLKRKNDAKVLSQAAVGPVRINWRHAEPVQDLSLQVPNTADEPSRTKTYVEKALKLNGGRTGSVGDNCHRDFGGIRDAPGSNWFAPFMLGDACEPYAVEKDAGQKVVFSKACVDAAAYPRKIGRAGVYFRPSCIAGDSYRLTAEIDFEGLPNKAQLESDHGVTDVNSRIKAGTGTFQIWRFNKVAVLVNWPARRQPPAVFGQNQWAEIKAEFEKAYLEIDVSGVASKNASDVLTLAEYQAIVTALTAHKDAGKIRLEADSLVGVDLPTQGKLNPDDYKTLLKTFTNDNYWDKIYDRLREKLSEKIRKDYPGGFIVVNFLTHRPCDIKKSLPVLRFVKVITERGYITWTFSIGLPDSVIFVDQRDPDHVYYVVAHEMGHNFWLKHWENAGGKTPIDHDTEDHNCLMSYSDSGVSPKHAHQAPGVFKPHLCGKCNLKLRGWNVEAAAMPAKS